MRLMRVLVALSVAFAFVAGAWAGDGNKPKKSGATPGMVEKVDLEGKSITLKTGKKKDTNSTTVTLALTDTTKVVIRTADGEKDGKLSDVTAGKRIAFKKETKDGKEIASQIMVIEGKKKS